MLSPLTTTSPVFWDCSRLPSISMTATLGPAAVPTVPGFRAEGGRGLLDIWCEASVIPYDSIARQLNVLSSSWSICGAKAAEDDRINRRLLVAMTSWLCFARCRIVWCIVGTAVYQLGLTVFSHLKNRKAEKPLEAATLAPAKNEDSAAPIKP